MISSGELRLELDKPCEINNRAEALKLVDKFISEQVYHKLLSKKFSRATIVSLGLLDSFANDTIGPNSGHPKLSRITRNWQMSNHNLS